MTFRDDDQRLSVCRTLLRHSPEIADLWTVTGPTSEAVDLLDRDGGPLGSGERVLLLLGFAIWSGTPSLAFRDLFHLDSTRLHEVGSLLTAIALGPEQIDRWIATQQR